ncbi:cysteine desulfurase [Candidatus Woesearchaeota archaeon]|nr:cysteine desulfurase [Candidatus Woesearchaeota archaeon]
MGFDVESVRQDFPILQRKKPPVYLDNACMTLRPRQVVDKVREYYEEYPACGGRSVHSLSQRVDDEAHKARASLKRFVNAKREREVVFQRNTTAGVNLVARSFPFQKGDVILVSDKEHNSNLLPWQVAARKRGLKLDVVESAGDNSFSMDNFRQKLEEHDGKVRMVAFGHTSNLDGATIPARDVVKEAHGHGSKVFLDAAQSAPHKKLDVQKLKADFVAFSGHKMLGPSGTGVLYGPEEELMTLDVNDVGGETVEDATYNDATWEGLPHRFEAGLQHYAGIIGLGAASAYLKKVGLSKVERHEHELNRAMTEGLRDLDGVDIVGPEDPTERSGIVSFTVEGMSSHDVAMMLSSARDVMIRSGAHCVHSWFNKHGLEGTARASAYLYNTFSDIEVFLDEVREALRLRR